MMEQSPLFPQEPDFGLPTTRRTDPETSHEAARRNINCAAPRRLLVLSILCSRPMTDYDLQRATGIQQNSIGKRRGELFQCGLVRIAVDADGRAIKRPAPSGSPALVWEITEEGRIFYAINAARKP